MYVDKYATWMIKSAAKWNSVMRVRLSYSIYKHGRYWSGGNCLNRLRPSCMTLAHLTLPTKDEEAAITGCHRLTVKSPS